MLDESILKIFKREYLGDPAIEGVGVFTNACLYHAIASYSVVVALKHHRMSYSFGHICLDVAFTLLTRGKAFASSGCLASRQICCESSMTLYGALALMALGYAYSSTNLRVLPVLRALSKTLRAGRIFPS